MLFSTKKDIENSEKKSKEFFNILKRRGLQKALQSICGPQATNFYLSVVFLSQTKTLEIHCILKEFFLFLKNPKVSKKVQPMLFDPILLYFISKYEMWFLLCLPSNSQYKKTSADKEGERESIVLLLFLHNAELC